MPYIQIRTNVSISKEKEMRIKELFGAAITIFNKSKDWLMVEFVSDCKMYFAGDVTSHVDYALIKKFCDEKCIEIVCLSIDKLADIGSIIIF